jgi:hypothetical protein
MKHSQDYYNQLAVATQRVKEKTHQDSIIADANIRTLHSYCRNHNIPKPKGLFTKRCPRDNSILKRTEMKTGGYNGCIYYDYYVCPKCDYEYA